MINAMLQSRAVSALYTIYSLSQRQSSWCCMVGLFCRGGSCLLFAAWFSFEHSAVVCYWCFFILFSTDRTSHGASAGCFPQHTQETSFMSSGAGRHRWWEKEPNVFFAPYALWHLLFSHHTVGAAWILFLFLAEKALTDIIVTGHAGWR